MPDGQHAPERLRRYLEDLKPEAQASLLADLEAGTLRADQLPEAELILAELRRMRTGPQEPPSPDQLFFAPIAAFVIDDNPARKHPGRIARGSLQRIWQWIARDLAPQQISTFAEEVAALAGRPADIEAAARRFQDHVGGAVHAAVAGTRTTTKPNGNWQVGSARRMASTRRARLQPFWKRATRYPRSTNACHQASAISVTTNSTT